MRCVSAEGDSGRPLTYVDNRQKSFIKAVVSGSKQPLYKSVIHLSLLIV